MSRPVYLPFAEPASTDGPHCCVMKRCPHLHVAQSDGEATCCAFDEPLQVKRGRRSGQTMFERCANCRTAERLFGEPGVAEPATPAEILDYEIRNARVVIGEWLADRTTTANGSD